MPPGIGSSGGGVCSNRYGVAENVGYMNDVAISYGYFSPGIIFLVMRIVGMHILVIPTAASPALNITDNMYWCFR